MVKIDATPSFYDKLTNNSLSNWGTSKEVEKEAFKVAVPENGKKSPKLSVLPERVERTRSASGI